MLSVGCFPANQKDLQHETKKCFETIPSYDTVDGQNSKSGQPVDS